jgi:hypothetical protein
MLTSASPIGSATRIAPSFLIRRSPGVVAYEFYTLTRAPDVIRITPAASVPRHPFRYQKRTPVRYPALEETR